MLSPLKIVFLGIAAWFIVGALNSPVSPLAGIAKSLNIQKPSATAGPTVHPWIATQYSEANGYYRAKEERGRWWPYKYSYWW